MCPPATAQDIVNQSNLAAAAYDGPIQTGLAQPPSAALTARINDFTAKQAEIMQEAANQILGSAALDAALASLRTATTNLNTTAAVMTDATRILNKAVEFLGYGTDAVNAIKSVTAGAPANGG